MKPLKYLLLLSAAVSLMANSLYADDVQDGSRFDEELNERDFDALRDYLRSKRAEDIVDNASTLTISGDVRTEWRHLNETCRGQRLRGEGAVSAKGIPISRNDFDVEFNLRFDYLCDKTWATVHVRYDNSAGVDDNGHSCGPVIDGDSKCCLDRARECFPDPQGYHGSGNCDDLCLKKAYMGYELYSNCDSRFFFELGRRGNLYNAFDSNIQFLSRFDGLLLKYESTWDCVADWYIQGAGFVVDERVNHFAWVVELGLLNVADYGIDLKYSLIDWEKHGENRCFARNPRGFRFINSQWTAIYHLNPEWMEKVPYTCLRKPVKFYGAFLVNHAAATIPTDKELWAQKAIQRTLEQRRDLRMLVRANPESPENPVRKAEIKELETEIMEEAQIVASQRKYRSKQNLGWYAGVLFGEVRKEGDWAIELQYQYVQAQAVPDGDSGGIGRGNVLDESFTTCSRRGNTNFKGWRLEGLYAFTDHFTLDTILEKTEAADPHIGGEHTYSKLEVEAIYAF